MRDEKLGELSLSENINFKLSEEIHIKKLSCLSSSHLKRGDAFVVINIR